ncbi:MAG: toll/interleukin-1 receptor domain-containing protein [Luteimonas sp.]|nr:toll/interleukin-1 receptor domain-containing protein [Luteimonas sp.]
MQIFISWSGERSKRVSLLLKEWLSCVIQSVRPWVSSKDIDRGSLWFSEISQQLGETSVGVICLTQENKEKPWILFEAGALAKGLNSSRVCTLLIDLEPKDIGDPLAQFNHTAPNKEGIFDLVQTLNAATDRPLDEKVLDRAFQTYWPQFESELQEILKDTKAATPSKPRKPDDVLGEILDNTRSLSTRIRKLEEQATKSGTYYRNRLADLAIDAAKQNEAQAVRPDTIKIKLADWMINQARSQKPDDDDSA